jgi:hypothetical protein
MEGAVEEIARRLRVVSHDLSPLGGEFLTSIPPSGEAFLTSFPPCVT